ncbi:MAG: Rqc2 family fibronectin-binding protein [Christensenellales bacterium]|jgi:predicted ribosome quality control (RQC) complex YloA/Tae2 family protein
MSLDALTLWGLTRELSHSLSGGRVDKVLQPEKDELHLLIRNHGTTFRLVVSASSDLPRIHLSNQSKLNPLSAPMFCMLLRKKIVSGQVLSVTQPGMERIVQLAFAVRDELGQIVTLSLYIELMGRHSNILLVDEHGRILDSIKHVTREMSRVREILPGLNYTPPPPTGKLDPLDLDEAGWLTFWQNQPSEDPEKILANSIAGLSYQSAERMLLPLSGSSKTPEVLAKICFSAYRSIFAGDFVPRLLIDEKDQPLDFTLLPCPGLLSKEVESLSQAMETCYSERDLFLRIRERSARISLAVRIHLDRARRKLEKQQHTLSDTENADRYRLWGELLTTYQHLHVKGSKNIMLPDHYNSEETFIDIPLDPSKGPIDNAITYYKRYKKARTARELLKIQIEANREEIAYLESVEVSIHECREEASLAEIQEELVRTGYMKESKMKATRRLLQSKPMIFHAVDGTKILVGRNNRQNDELTLCTANSEDIWLHAQKIPGSHVLLRCAGSVPSEVALSSAALLAAWYSKAQGSSRIPVDYTLRKYVKKPNGAKPGFVVYTNQRTLYVTPSAEDISRLQKKTQ